MEIDKDLNINIIHKGKTLNTKHRSDISDEECRKIRDTYFLKPDRKSVINEMKKLFNGGSSMKNINNFFFKDLMAKTKLYHSKWSIEEMFECNNLIRYFYARTKLNDKMFGSNVSEKNKIEKIISLGGKGVCTKPSNFPIKTVIDILKLYNINNNYYDYSCGWGARLIGSLSCEINYYGSDPNNLLVDKLNRVANWFKIINNIESVETDIRREGSEIFVQEWEGKMGVAFSSPPYFNLEDYKIGKQSTKGGITYTDWLNGYFKSTVKNIYRYLIDDGYFILNVKNYDKYNLVKDMRKICEKNGFFLYAKHQLKNIKRTNSKGGFNDNSEDIMVFKKEEQNGNR